MLYKYLLSLGSNIEPKLDHLKRAIHELSGYGQIIKKSAIYKSEPWGKKNQTDFFNAVIELHTVYTPQELLDIISKIETEMGRIRSEKWGQRIIDIDILFAGDLVIDEVNLQIPHRLLTQRKFVLMPLADVTADLHLPLFSKSARCILDECLDTSTVEKLSISWEEHAV